MSITMFLSTPDPLKVFISGYLTYFSFYGCIEVYFEPLKPSESLIWLTVGPEFEK